MNEQELRASISRVMRGLNHDLKNPLGAADGYLDLLLQGFRGDISDEQRQTLERVRTLIAAGVEILEDIVGYVRAELGELRVHRTDTELGATVRLAMQKHEARAAENGIALEFASDGPVRTQTDGEVVTRVLDRMLENALDHAPDGGRVDVRLAREDGRAVIRVTDTGPGIQEAERPGLFEPFERGRPPARPRASAGIGIGLALARALARGLGGTLDLAETESADGTGASFELSLPVEA